MLIQDKSSEAPASSGLRMITAKRFLSESTFVLRFDRGDLVFRAGQKIVVGLDSDLDQREYSVYSGEQNDYLEILVREVSEGNVSMKLRHAEPGQLININGPFGSLGIESFTRYSAKHIFVATGTGISPFHSMIISYPALDYTLFHGVRFKHESYDNSDYDPARYILCTSAESSEGKKGRVTRFLSKFKVSNDMIFYLCGNGNMIYEVWHLLRDKGIPAERILSEIYF